MIIPVGSSLSARSKPAAGPNRKFFLNLRSTEDMYKERGKLQLSLVLLWRSPPHGSDACNVFNSRQAPTETGFGVELAAYIVVAVLLLAAGYLFVVHVTQQSEWARAVGLILSLVALFVLGKWGYPRP
jgi:hypothetical protein